MLLTIRILHKTRGIGLIGVIMASVILGILTFSVAQFARQAIRAATHVAEVGELEDLRRVIRVKLDCTKSRATIVSGGSILLRDANNLPIFQETGTTMKMGRWSIEARTSGPTDIPVSVRGPTQPQRELFSPGPRLQCP